MSSFGGPGLILTVPGGSSRPNKTSSVKKSKFSKLSLMPFCQITAEFKICLFEKPQYYGGLISLLQARIFNGLCLKF